MIIWDFERQNWINNKVFLPCKHFLGVSAQFSFIVRCYGSWCCWESPWWLWHHHHQSLQKLYWPLLSEYIGLLMLILSVFPVCDVPPPMALIHATACSEWMKRLTQVQLELEQCFCCFE